MTEDLFEKALEKLRSAKEDARREAVLEMLRLRDRRALDVLANLVASDLSVEVRYYGRKAYYLLRDVLPVEGEVPPLELPEGISLDDLEHLLKDENPRIRAEALTLCAKIDPGSVAPLLRTALEAEKSLELQATIITALGKIAIRQDIPLIAQYLGHDDARIRANAVDALAYIGGPEALEYVVPLLRDLDNRVRANAVKALQSLENIELLKILRNMAMSPQVAYRDSAIFTLQRFKAPVASKILAHLAKSDPVPSIREKALAGLEAMAKSDPNARKALEELNAPETAEEDEQAPPAAGPAPAARDGTAPAAPPPPPKYMVVPGVAPKLVREMCDGDALQREAGLKQVAATLTPDHLPFFLHRLEREQDPRVLSYLLSLIGKTRVNSAYAVVIKHFKHPDDRVKANAIEAAAAIDPVTTPNRVTGFLSDRNNRIRANAIIACASGPSFDPLVWVKDLAGAGEPAFRRSALFVITRLRRPAFIPVIEMLLDDGELEVRYLAFKALKEFAEKGVPGAKKPFEAAAERIAKEQKAAGKFDEDFHSAMIAMRTSAPPKRIVKKDEKSAGREFAEQLLGEDGLKKAGQTLKNLQSQARVAQVRVSASLSDGNWSSKARSLGKAVVVLLVAGAAAFVVARQYGPLAPHPIRVSEDTTRADTAGAPPPGKTATPAAGLPSAKPASAPAATETVAAKADAAIRLLAPARGTEITDTFTIRARVSGKPASVSLFLGDTCLKRFDTTREGIVEHEAARGPEHVPGSYLVKARVSDAAGRHHEDMVLVRVLSPLPRIAIAAPGAVVWRDDRLAASVTGLEEGDVEFLLDDTVVQAFHGAPAPAYELPLPLTTLADGVHTFTVRITLPDDRQASASATFVKALPDPVIRILSPKTGEDIYGLLSIEFEVEGGLKNVPVRRVTWFSDGQQRSVIATAPWKTVWDVTDEAPGPHEIRATVENEAGRTAEAKTRFNVVKPLFSASFTGVAAGQVLEEDTEGTLEIRDELPGLTIRKVLFAIDDTPLGEAASPPFSFSIRVDDVLPGPRKLNAEAFRSDGKSFRTSVPFSVKPRGRCVLFLSAADREGNLLSPSVWSDLSLSVKEDGEAVATHSLKPGDRYPVDFGLVIDVSASMKADRRLDHAKEAASAFFEAMRPTDRGFLVTSAAAPRVAAGLTGDRRKLQQEIEYLAPQPGNSLLDAVHAGLEVSAGDSGRLVIVVLTDGEENDGGSAARAMQDLIGLSRRRHVQIFGIGLGRALAGVRGNAEEMLKELALETGGRYRHAATGAELGEAFQAVMQEVRGQWRLSYPRPYGVSDGKWHTVEVSAPNHPGITVTGRPGYLAY